MNMISQIRQRASESKTGEITITVDEFNQLQAEWITRVRIAVSDVCPVQALQFKNDKPVTHQ